MSDIFEALVKAQREADQRRGNHSASPPARGAGDGSADEATASRSANGNGAAQGRGRVRRGHRWWSWLRRSRNGSDEGQVLVPGEDSAIAEQFRVLRTRIEVERPGTLMITSALGQEGKTFCATNLAVALSMRFGPGVILVDADLRRSSVATRFGLEDGPGLAECLMGDAQWRDCLVATKYERLQVLPAGRQTAMACELLGSERMHMVAAELKAEYPHHHIVFDSPPVLLAADPLIVARYMDHVVLVVRAGLTPRAAVLKALEALGPDRVMGIVFNGATDSISGHYHYYGRQYGDSDAGDRARS